MASDPIYLDYNSTTPVDERVLKAILPFFTLKFGNASSRSHSFGWIAEEAVSNARSQVANLLGCLPQEIIFTSGSTEAVNIAIKGVYKAYSSKGNHIISVKTEHKAVLDVLASLEKKGAEITLLDVDADGLINLQELEKAITEKTVLVSIMYANNETGVVQDVQKISEIVHSRNSIFFSDATQAIGKVPVNVERDGISLLALSAHKIYGPKGVGALYIRRKNPRVTLLPVLDGGGQEKGLRPGTYNVPGIVGLGKACELAASDFSEIECIKELRDKLEEGLLKIKGALINGSRNSRLPNTLNISFKGFRADSIISGIKSIAVSTGSACTSAIPEPSHVLKAMGLSDEEAYASIRFSLGRYTTMQEIEETIALIKHFVKA
jgi:cysteine desulfurase